MAGHLHNKFLLLSNDVAESLTSDMKDMMVSSGNNQFMKFPQKKQLVHDGHFRCHLCTVEVYDSGLCHAGTITGSQQHQTFSN
jgi:hypothetical protein